jgi:hypothetical protein
VTPANAPAWSLSFPFDRQKRFDYEKGCPPIVKRKRLFILIGLLLCVAGLIWIGWIVHLPTHPRFGTVYETSASDLNEARSDWLGVFLRKHLPDRIVQSPNFPDRFKDRPRYLQLGRWQFEWSIGGSNSGWFYFSGVDGQRGNEPRKWEFALCSETNLMRVTQLPSDFCGALDPRRKSLFGEDSTSNAIKVTVGQILFIRRTDDSDVVYVVKLTEQRGNRLIVNYCAAGTR